MTVYGHRDSARSFPEVAGCNDAPALMRTSACATPGGGVKNAGYMGAGRSAPGTKRHLRVFLELFPLQTTLQSLQTRDNTPLENEQVRAWHSGCLEDSEGPFP
jgi:hypothetical protein